MSASDSLSPNQFYHVASSMDRGSIAEHGLDHTRGDSAYAGHMAYPPGNYLFSDRDAAETYRGVREREERDEYGPQGSSYDIWRVHGVPSPIHRDPFHDDASGLGEHSAYTQFPISPSQLKRL